MSKMKWQFHSSCQQGFWKQTRIQYFWEPVQTGIVLCLIKHSHLCAHRYRVYSKLEPGDPASAPSALGHAAGGGGAAEQQLRRSCKNLAEGGRVAPCCIASCKRCIAGK